MKNFRKFGRFAKICVLWFDAFQNVPVSRYDLQVLNKNFSEYL